MQLRLTRPWRDLNEAEVSRLPGQLGVYELADEDGQVIYVGYAGGKSLFGLRSAVQGHIGSTRAARFRYEVNSQYMSRYHELLMLHARDDGDIPELNRATHSRRRSPVG
ncbi:hypothetical protein EDM76_08475 [bacterium]|nr:MAG: hypothetical protein EDM76_08475 [bacterium]MCL4230024.1 hypothetical protein [Dehalococcoidia bacterium]